jgi:hypothetical protein
MRTVTSFDCDAQGGLQIMAIVWRGLSNNAQGADGG